MAHEVETMMSAGGTVPWHKLGTVLPRLATLDEAYHASGLDWAVGLYPLEAVIGDMRSPCPDAQAVVRDKDDKVLGVVGSRYQPVQNFELFSLGADIIGADGDDVVWETAGSLRGGTRVWCCLNLGAFFPVDNDKIDKYLVLHSSHDGSTYLSAMTTGIRVVCMNTLRKALRSHEAAMKVRHSGDVQGKASEAAQILGIARKEFTELEEAMRAFAGYPLSEDVKNVVLDRTILLPAKVSDDKEGKGYTQAMNRRDLIQELAMTGKGTEIPGVRGTLYGLYQAIAEYADHELTIRPRKAMPESAQDVRAESQLWGPGARLKDRAFRACMEFVK